MDYVIASIILRDIGSLMPDKFYPESVPDPTLPLGSDTPITMEFSTKSFDNRCQITGHVTLCFNNRFSAYNLHGAQIYLRSENGKIVSTTLVADSETEIKFTFHDLRKGVLYCPVILGSAVFLVAEKTEHCLLVG